MRFRRPGRWAGSAGGFAGMAALGAFGGAPGAVRAQDCVWTARPNAGGPGASGFRGVFVSAQSRSLLVGLPSSAASMQLWASDQAGWTLLASGGPSARYGFAVAYDTARGRLVLFGGRAPSTPTQYFGDTWEWDGAAWAIRTQSGPSARSGHALAYDAARARVVLFGGVGVGGLPTDTWQWDGLQWVSIPVPGPNSRSAPAMTYDSDRGRTVMFGGSGVTSLLADTWEWDGSAWAQRAASGPAPRSGAQVVYDSGRHRAVLFGGASSASLTDTWEYDGTAAVWTFRSGGGPATNSGRCFVFDTSRGLGLYFESATTVWEWRGSASNDPPWFSQHPPCCAGVVLGGSVSFSVAGAGTGPLSYQWRHGSTPLVNGGSISGADTPTLEIDPAAITDLGLYSAVVSSGCGSATSAQVYLSLIGQCYANCDSSWTSPYLNVQDFGCFLNRFASGSSHANCDGSTLPPILNVQDFGCFLNAYAAGCSAP